VTVSYQETLFHESMTQLLLRVWMWHCSNEHYFLQHQERIQEVCLAVMTAPLYHRCATQH